MPFVMRIEPRGSKPSPEMHVTAETLNGKRRVLEYLLSSVHKVFSESLGETLSFDFYTA